MKYVEKSITDAAEVMIAHGVNLKGKMGAGVALAIRDKWQKVYDDYQEAFNDQQLILELGDVVFTMIENANGDNVDHVVASIVTQKSYGRDGKRYVNYAALIQGLWSIVDNYPDFHYIAIPRIGANLGGGDWNLISTLLTDFEDAAGIEFVVYTGLSEK